MASTDKVHFDLDAVEREEFEVFAFTVKNDAGEERRIELTDPADVDYQDLLEIDNPLGFFRYTMKESDRDFFATTRIKGWRLSRLLEAYLKHYKADERVDPRAKVSNKLGF